MSTAPKMIDWRYQDGAELVKELQALPDGRYRLVPEEEGFDQADPGELLELTPETIEKAREAARREDGSVSALLFAANLSAPLNLRASLTGPRWARHKDDLA